MFRCDLMSGKAERPPVLGSRHRLVVDWRADIKPGGIAERTDGDVRAAAERCGVHVLDASGALDHDPSLRCANAYNLNGKGAQVVGDLLGEWLLENAMRADREVASPARTSAEPLRRS